MAFGASCTQACILCIAPLRLCPSLLSGAGWWWCVDSIISNVPSFHLKRFSASALLLFLPPGLSFTWAWPPCLAALDEIGVEVDVPLNLHIFNQHYFWEFMIVFSCLGKGEFGRMKVWWIWESYLLVRIQEIKEESYGILKGQSVSWISLESKYACVTEDKFHVVIYYSQNIGLFQ